MYIRICPRATSARALDARPGLLSWNIAYRQPFDVRPAPIRPLFLVSASSAASPAFDLGLVLFLAHNDFPSYITTCTMLSFVTAGYSRVLTLYCLTAFSYFPLLSPFSVFTPMVYCSNPTKAPLCFILFERYIRAGVFTDQASIRLRKKNTKKDRGNRKKRFGGCVLRSTCVCFVLVAPRLHTSLGVVLSFVHPCIFFVSGFCCVFHFFFYYPLFHCFYTGFLF